MRFLNSNRGQEAADDSDFEARLSAIASRGKCEGETYPKYQEPVKPQRVQRRFRRPGEVVAAKQAR